MARVDLAALPAWGKQVEGAYEGGPDAIFPARPEHNAKIVLWYANRPPLLRARPGPHAHMHLMALPGPRALILAAFHVNSLRAAGKERFGG